MLKIMYGETLVKIVFIQRWLILKNPKRCVFTNEITVYHVLKYLQKLDLKIAEVGLLVLKKCENPHLYKFLKRVAQFPQILFATTRTEHLGGRFSLIFLFAGILNKIPMLKA